MRNVNTSFMKRGFTEKSLYALFNLRFESFRFVRGQFSATQCQICLPQPGIKGKKRRVGGNRQKVVSKQTKRLCPCRCVPLNGEIIIVPDIYLPVFRRIPFSAKRISLFRTVHLFIAFLVPWRTKFQSIAVFFELTNKTDNEKFPEACSSSRISLFNHR